MIERTTFLYEILLRFGPDGFVGAHVIDLERVADGDEIIAEREFPARPITEAEVGGFIGAESARLVEAVDAARAEAALWREAAEAAQRELAAATAASTAEAPAG